MTLRYQQVLSAARRLPKSSQAKLVAALLREADYVNGSAPQPLIGFSEAELRALADASLGPGRTRRLKQLLRRNREGKLSRAERLELEQLLEESDLLALMKARAQYTLQLQAA